MSDQVAQSSTSVELAGWITTFAPVVSFVSGITVSAVLFIWRLAVWTNTVTRRLDEQDRAREADRLRLERALAADRIRLDEARLIERHEHDRQHADIIEKLDQMQSNARDQHSATIRELDQIRADARTLTGRVDHIGK